jgi:hypothetical protein
MFKFQHAWQYRPGGVFGKYCAVLAYSKGKDEYCPLFDDKELFE